MIHLIKQNGQFSIYFPSTDHKVTRTRQRRSGAKKWRDELEPVECGRSILVSNITAKQLFDAAKEANAISTWSYVDGDADIFIRQDLFN